MTNCHHYDSINIQVKSHEYQRLRRIEKAAKALIVVGSLDYFGILEPFIKKLEKEIESK